MPARRRPTELAIGEPLQILKEHDAVGAVPGELADLGRTRIAHCRRPRMPGKFAACPQEILVQRLENRKVDKALSARLTEILKILRECAAQSQFVAAEALEQRFQERALQGGDRFVIDQRGVVRRRNRRRRRESLR